MILNVSDLCAHNPTVSKIQHSSIVGMGIQTEIECTLGPAYNEYGYYKHPVTTSKFLCIKFSPFTSMVKSPVTTSKFTHYPTYYKQKEAIAHSKWGNFTHFEHLISDNLFYHTLHVANCLHFSLSVCFTLHLNKYRLFQKVDFVDVSAIRSTKFMKSTGTHNIQQMYIYFDQPIFQVGGGESHLEALYRGAVQ